MMDQEQGTTTVEARASVVEFVDVEVIDDRGPKVLVKLGQINNGEPVDVANTALFLASEEGRYYTGSILHPDGGITMQ